MSELKSRELFARWLALHEAMPARRTEEQDRELNELYDAVERAHFLEVIRHERDW